MSWQMRISQETINSCGVIVCLIYQSLANTQIKLSMAGLNVRHVLNHTTSKFN